MALPVGIAGKRGVRGVVDDGWRELGRWPQRGCYGRERWRGVAGHGEFLASGWRAVRWRAGLTPALERLDDDHVSAAAWARRTDIERLLRHAVVGRWRDGEEFVGAREAGLARRTREQAIVADAVEPPRQDVKQEAADELIDCRAS